MAVAQPFQFDCKMTCSGCSGAITRVLTKAKADGRVKDFAVDLDSQLVSVTPGSVSYDEVFKIIDKTGKAINVGDNGDGNKMAYTEEGLAKAGASALTPKPQ